MAPTRPTPRGARRVASTIERASSIATSRMGAGERPAADRPGRAARRAGLPTRATGGARRCGSAGTGGERVRIRHRASGVDRPLRRSRQPRAPRSGGRASGNRRTRRGRSTVTVAWHRRWWFADECGRAGHPLRLRRPLTRHRGAVNSHDELGNAWSPQRKRPFSTSAPSRSTSKEPVYRCRLLCVSTDELSGRGAGGARPSPGRAAARRRCDRAGTLRSGPAAVATARKPVL